MAMLPSWLDSISKQLQQNGINVFGITCGKAYTNHLTGCRSIIVFANGGTDLWDAFIKDIEQQPNHLTGHLHPFDDFVHRLLQEADPNPPKSRRWIRCAENEETFVDMRPLAQQAGIGNHSHMGMLIHPEYGLWLGIRAILLTTEYIEPTTVTIQSPCGTCIEKPCISSCIGNAVLQSGWDVQRCAQAHLSSTKCHHRCASRLSCPVGITHRHSLIQHQYHSNRNDGRKELAQQLGIADHTQGVNLPWKNWTC